MFMLRRSGEAARFGNRAKVTKLMDLHGRPPFRGRTLGSFEGQGVGRATARGKHYACDRNYILDLWRDRALESERKGGFHGREKRYASS